MGLPLKRDDSLAVNSVNSVNIHDIHLDTQLRILYIDMSIVEIYAGSDM